MSRVPPSAAPEPDQPEPIQGHRFNSAGRPFVILARKITNLPTVAWFGLGAAVILIGWIGISISDARESARRGSSLCHMKSLTIAQQNYLDRHGRFPAAGDRSKSQLSWRVHLLRYMDQDDMFHQFHFDEPWDS